MQKFEVVMNIPSPYRVHLFTEMYRQLQARGIEFHVHFLSDMKRGHEARPRAWHNPKMEFPYTYWRDYGIRHYHFNPGLLLHLLFHKPDYLLSGTPFDTFTTILLPFVARKSSRCTWTEGNTKTTGQMTGFKGWFKRFIFSKYPLVAVPGVEGQRYVALHQEHTRMRMPLPILLPNLVDEKRFKPRSEWPADEIANVRHALGADNDIKVCIIPARLEWFKGLLEFINALPSVNDLLSWRIIIMGQGSLKSQIKDLVTQRGLKEIISIMDYVAYSEMPKYYAAADLFLLPSMHDPNPLTVVEAAHSGLPLAVSILAGNVDEAVTPERNGWRLPVLDDEGYRRVLAEVFSASLEDLRKKGLVSKDNNAKFWDTKGSVSRFLDKYISM